jgi:hypothetical protein
MLILIGTRCDSGCPAKHYWMDTKNWRVFARDVGYVAEVMSKHSEIIAIAIIHRISYLAVQKITGVRSLLFWKWISRLAGCKNVQSDSSWLIKVITIIIT